MPSASKRKGDGYEFELVNQAKEAGIDCVRARGSDGRSIGEAEDVDIRVGRFRIQAKRRRKLAKYLDLSETVDATVFRQDRGETLICLRWADFLELYRHYRELLSRQEQPPCGEPQGPETTQA